MKISPDTLAGLFLQMDLFESIPRAVSIELATHSRIRRVAAGEVIFHKNDAGDALYMILEGDVKVHDDDYVVAHQTAGSFFGELALLDEGPRSMSITATTDTVLAVIGRVEVYTVLKDYPAAMQTVISMLTRRLRQQTDRLVDQLRRREEELTRLVEERTAEVMREKEEAERQRAQAEAEKKEAQFQRQRAEQSERFKQQFLANMSHELRTPMNAVMGMTHILLQKQPRKDQLKYLDSVMRSSKNLLVILNEILDISKIEAGKMELESTDLDVSNIVEHVLSTLGYRAEEKKIDLLTDLDPAIPSVLTGDPVRLQQILLNLTGNAIKFTEKGEVVLSVRVLERAGTACRLRFAVRDTGIGMTPEQTSVVFESFRQASGDTTRKYGGTGLGLSISKHLVELFGGALRVDSEPGKGSVFSFDVSLGISASKSIAEQEEVSQAMLDALTGARILIAEDNRYNLIVATETLELKIPGVQITAALNGVETIEKYREGQFDLILMDVHMPVMDGLEATRRIRETDKDIPILALTASVIKSEVQNCLDGGMSGWIPKPFRDVEFFGAIYNALHGNKNDLPELPEEEPAPPLPAESSGNVDLKFLEELTGGNPARIRKYVGLYLESASTLLPQIEAAFITGDYERLRRLVHTMKPQFRMVGLPHTGDLAARIEASLADGQAPDNLPEAVGQLMEETRRSVVAFETYLQTA